MVTRDTIKDKIHDLLIEKDGDVQPHELKFIIEEAKQIGITDKQIAKLVPEVDRAINWEQIRKQKEEIALRKQELEEFTKKEEQKKLNAPEFIESLLQFSFSDGIVEAQELQAIFNKAAELSQDENVLARRYKAIFDKNKFKPYPNPKLNTTSLKESLLSTNWYNQQHYIKLTTPPPPPTPFPWKIVISVLLILLTAWIIGYLFYNEHIKSKEADIKAKEAELKLKEAEYKLSIEKAKQDSIAFIRGQELRKQKDAEITKTQNREEKERKQREIKDQELRKQKEADAAAAYNRERDLKKQKDLEAKESEEKRQRELAKQCKICNGTGYIIEYEKCVKCNGTGKKILGKCNDCDGIGKTKKEIKLTCKKCNGVGKIEN